VLDIEIRAPRCPGCDQPPMMVVGTRQAFCGTDACQVFTWDLAESPERFKATAQIIDLDLGGKQP
jgi:hypothetical protein